MATLFDLWCLIGFVSVVAYVPLQIFAVLHLHGVWRILAFAPVLLFAPVFTVLDMLFAKQIQENNMFGLFELLCVAPAAPGYLTILLIIQHKVMQPRGAGSLPKTISDGPEGLDT